MKIKKIIHQENNHLKATFECEHCENEFVGSGINNTDFHNIVLPNLNCPDCKLNSFREPELITIRKLRKTLTLPLEQLFSYVEDHLRPKCSDCDYVGIRKARNGQKYCSKHYGEFVLNTYQE
jgi:hypothetical protein